MISSRTVLKCALLGSLIFQLGCATIWHELQPHRVQRMNRGPAPSLDPEFTHWKPTRPARMVDDVDTKSATLSANSAEVAIVRAQSLR